MIPDSDPGGVGDTVAMGVSFAIQDLDVEVNINHTWVGDLCVMLSHNGGAPIELLRRPGLEPDTCEPGVCCGCSADNYSGTVLDDDRATGTIEASCTAGNTGRFTPNHPLSTFDGEDSAGNWTLQVSDGAADDLGTLISWALIFTPPPAGSTSCAQQVPCQCAGDADCDPGQRCVGGLCLETGACCLCQGSRCAGTVVATCTEGLTADQCGILGDYQGDGSVCLPDGCAGKCPECHDNADCADGICLDGRCTRPDSGDDDDDGGDLPGDDDDDNG